MLGDRAERQGDAETFFVDFQIRPLMLQDDRQLARPLFGEAARNRDARRVGAEADGEVMVAGQIAALGDVAQHFAHDAAHGVLNEKIVANNVFSHCVAPDCHPYGRPATASDRHACRACITAARREKIEVEASVARRLLTPPRSANP